MLYLITLPKIKVGNKKMNGAEAIDNQFKSSFEKIINIENKNV